MQNSHVWIEARAKSTSFKNLKFMGPAIHRIAGPFFYAFISASIRDFFTALLNNFCYYLSLSGGLFYEAGHSW